MDHFYIGDEVRLSDHPYYHSSIGSRKSLPVPPHSVGVVESGPDSDGDYSVSIHGFERRGVAGACLRPASDPLHVLAWRDGVPKVLLRCDDNRLVEAADDEGDLREVGWVEDSRDESSIVREPPEEDL